MIFEQYLVHLEHFLYKRCCTKTCVFNVFICLFISGTQLLCIMQYAAMYHEIKVKLV